MDESLQELVRKLQSTGKPARGNLPTGLEPLDELAGGGFARGAVHEILSEVSSPAILLALLADAATRASIGRIVWCDRARWIYPPALQSLGIPIDRITLIRVTHPAEELWAMSESLRCPGVGVCIAGSIHPAGAVALTRLEARRLQLSAERGGGVGLLLRPPMARHLPYAAATRWFLHPAPGEKNLQRWRLELIHGHGGRIGQSVFLEVSREFDSHEQSSPQKFSPQKFSLRAFNPMADRPRLPERIVMSA